jgi:hypothetical protein
MGRQVQAKRKASEAEEDIMYSVAWTVPVNPQGAFPILTREQLWEGLVMKARDAKPFVGQAMEECRVLQEYDDGFLREIVLRGVRMTERITFTPMVKVRFERIEAQGFDGWIDNVMSDSEQGLQLTFTFSVGFPGLAHGSAEERTAGEKVKESYFEAVRNTIDETRRRAASAAA